MEYLTLTENGGVGMHYMYRDLCLFFVELNKGRDASALWKEHPLLCHKFLRCVLTKLGDATEKVLQANLDIFKDVFAVFDNKVRIDLGLLLKMLSGDQKTRVWQITGVRVLEIMVDAGSPVFESVDSDGEGSRGTECPSQPVDDHRHQMMRKFEKALLGLTSLNSKLLFKALGRLFGKLEKAKVLLGDFRCCNGELFGVKLLEGSPRVSKKLLILLSEIALANPSFYCKQSCLHNTILEVLRAFNQTHTFHALLVVSKAFEPEAQSTSSDLHFIASNIFEFLPNILRIRSAALTAIAMKLMLKVLHFDTPSYYDIICKQCRVIADTATHPGKECLKKELAVFVGVLFEKGLAFKADSGTVIEMFLLLARMSDCFSAVFDQVVRTTFFDQVLSLKSFCDLLLRLSDPSHVLLCFNVYLMILLRKDSDSFETLFTLDQSVHLPLGQQFKGQTEFDFGRFNLTGTEVEGHTVVGKNKEGSPVVDDSDLFDKDCAQGSVGDIEGQDIRDDDLNESYLDLLQSQNQTQPIREAKAIRFSKATNEMMPQSMLRLYTKSGKSRTDKMDSASPSQIDFLDSTFHNFKKDFSLVCRSFAIFASEVLGGLRGQRKVDFVGFLSDLYLRAFSNESTPEEVRRTLSGLFFEVYKRGKLVTTTNELLLAKLNFNGCKLLALLANEEYLLRVSKTACLNNKRTESSLRWRFRFEHVAEKEATAIEGDPKEEELARDRKKVKQSSSIGVAEQTNGKCSEGRDATHLVESMLENAMDYAAGEEPHAVFRALNRGLLPESHPALSIDIDHNCADAFDRLSSLDESASSQLVKRLLNAQKKECVKRLQRWEEVVVLVAEDERSRIVLDQNDEVHVNGFSKMKPGNQKQLVRCFLHDRRQRQRFPSFINQVCQSKADSSYFETTFAEELSLFWLEKDDINRARYFNELSKDNIRLVKARSVEENKEEFFCAVDNCMLVKEAIAFVEENRPAENWLSTDAICSLLTLEGRRGRHCDEGLVLDRFLAKRTVVDFLIAKFSAFDCSVLQSVRCINQVKFADFCLSRGDTQRAEDTLSAVEFPILLANGRHLLDFAEVNARLRLQQLRLGHRGGVDRNGPADSFLTTVAHSTRNSEVSLGLKCQNYRLQLGTWDFDKVECSKDTLKGILADVRESAGQVEWTDSKWREFPIVFELTGRLAKGLIQQAIAGEKQDGVGSLIETFCDSMSRLFAWTDAGFRNHKMPFIFKIAKHFPQFSETLFSSFLDKVDPCRLFGWVPQFLNLLQKGSGCSDSAFNLLVKLAFLSPETLSSHIYFKRELPAVARLIGQVDSEVKPYFRLFDSLLCLCDPEELLTDALKSIELDICAGELDFPKWGHLLAGVMEKSSSKSSKFHSEFLNRFNPIVSEAIEGLRVADPSRLKQVLDRVSFEVRESLKSKYSRPEVPVSHFSEELSCFSSTFALDNQLSYFFAREGSSPIRITDLQPKVTVMSSLMRPKKLSFLCSDNKVRVVLAKFGEDLQEDSRIMTIFGILNSMIEQGSEELGHRRTDTRLVTYRVLNVEKNFGLIEWIPDSQSVKSIIEEEMQGDSRVRTASTQNIANSPSMEQRRKFLSGLDKAGLANGGDFVAKHLELLSLDASKVVEEFDAEVGLFQGNLLKTALMKKARTQEEFLKQRKVLLQEYALACVASYLLGIGDRHLDNILLVGHRHFSLIDFGCSFDFGIHLPVPELVPFRMTPVFIQLGFPFEIDGTFFNAFQHNLGFFKMNMECLTDYIEVYLSDPIQKWVVYHKNSKDNRSEFQNEEFIQWKVSQFTNKLNFADPVGIYLQELARSKHSNKHYFPRLVETIRSSCVKQITNKAEAITEQLMSIATNKNTLGRMWTGWLPFV